MIGFSDFPQQQLPFSKKGKEWRRKHLDWAERNTFFNSSAVENTVVHDKINYDLITGTLSRDDMETIMNPDGIDMGIVSTPIQHYPIMNTKLDVLRGEESKRRFDYKVVVTNQDAISDIEDRKKKELFGKLQETIQQNTSKEDYQAAVEKLSDYYSYEWQDLRELRGNTLLNHYVRELSIPIKFNEGFMDAMTCGKELYQCDIVGGEPTFDKLDPLKIRIFKSGYSNKVEDADIILYEDYWSPGKIFDTFYDQLTDSDRQYIEKSAMGHSESDSMDNEVSYGGPVIDTGNELDLSNLDISQFDSDPGESVFSSEQRIVGSGYDNCPYDIFGNIRVIRLYWKSRRKVKRVKSYDRTTGDEVYDFYPETYILDESMGEEEETFWINEAWEGTKIGEKVYVNIRPRLVQYSRMSNPSRCYFGIVGSIYNLNGQKPFSLVDRMKPYNYLYDSVHDKLNKALAANWGKLLEVDLASIPQGWDIDKFLYYAKVSHMVVKDSFKEGNVGEATGKLAGGFAANSRGAIDAEQGQYIQYLINFLEYIKSEMSEVAGITRQREGQISNRETVGGVERSTLQSSYITEWLFTIHEDLKRRALECLLETAKIALRGKKEKFQYILPNSVTRMIEIDGDEFSENDYGIVVDGSNNVSDLEQKLDTLAQAALQNQMLSFSTVMKIYTNTSLSSVQRLIEKDELETRQRTQEAQQQQIQSQQQIVQSQNQLKQKEIDMLEQQNIRDNDTKIAIARIQAEAKNEVREGALQPEASTEERDRLLESMRQFDSKISLEKEKMMQSERERRSSEELKKKEIEERIANEKSRTGSSA